MRRPTNGFTIIELLFAMSFVAVLLILILTATLQVTRIYNKGITLKQVNQSGAAVAGGLQSSLKAADAPLTTTGVSRGRLCLGTYSYVWNTPTLSPKNSYTDGTQMGMAEVADTGGTLCPASGSYPNVDKSKARELILSTDTTQGVKLVLRDLSIDQGANSGANYLYHVAFTVSTDDSTLIQNDKCKGSAGDEFCALNSFGFDVFMKQGGSGNQ